MVMKTVRSEARAACCMLCVTTTMVYSRLSSRISSSIWSVARGSSADAGSALGGGPGPGHAPPVPVEPRPEGAVVVDRLGERVRLLEAHPDPPTDLHRVDPWAVQVLAIEHDPALHAERGDTVVHPVQGPQEGRIPP